MALENLDISDEAITDAMNILTGQRQKSGRPTTEVQEAKGLIAQAKNINGILKILTDPNFQNNLRSFIEVKGEIKSQPEEKAEKKTSGLFSQLFKGDFTKVKEIFDDSSEDATRTILTKGLPVIGALTAIWLAEKHVEGFPPVLHTGTLILNAILGVLNAIMKFLQIVGEIPGQVGDLVGDFKSGLEKTVEDPLGAGKNFIDKEVATFQSLVDRAAKGDIVAIAELAARGNPVTGIPLMGLDLVASIFGF